MGGRSILIKSSLASLPMYYLSLFPIPKGALQKITRIQRDFFWNGCSEKKQFTQCHGPCWRCPKYLEAWIWGTCSIEIWHCFLNGSGVSSCPPLHYGRQSSMKNMAIRMLSRVEISQYHLKKAHGKEYVEPYFNILLQKIWYFHVWEKRLVIGNFILFCHDLWIGNKPLKILCPRLFSISTLPNGLVSSLWFWDGRSWNWSLSWVRTLRPQDMIERSILQILLDKVVLSPENSDSLVWRPKKSGEFSVKSFSMELAKSYHNGQNGIIKGVWNGLVPHRIEIFTWLTLIRKINTKAKLASLGIIPPNQSTCILCDQEVEILGHLFLHCIMARKIWQWWLEIWNVKGAFPSSLRSMYDQWLPPPLKGKFF